MVLEYLQIGVRCLLFVVFAASVVGKARSRESFRSFARSLGDLEMMPASALGPAALTLTAAEAVICVLLAPEPTYRLGLLLAAILLGVFAGAIGWTVRRGVQASCHCFGAAGRSLGTVHVVRNVVLAAAAIAALVGSPGNVDLVGAALALASGVVAALLIVRFDDIADLFAPSTRYSPPGRARGSR